jgi:hypothetical protein
MPCLCPRALSYSALRSISGGNLFNPNGTVFVCWAELIYGHSVLLYSLQKTLGVNIEPRLTVTLKQLQYTGYCLTVCADECVMVVFCRALQQAISQPLTNYDEVCTVVCTMPCAAIQLAES